MKKLIPFFCRGYRQRVFGGLLSGLGWGLHGACPGPIYTLLGQGEC